MAIHKVIRDGYAYFIPDDDLFEKLNNGEVYIDVESTGHSCLKDKKTNQYVKKLKRVKLAPPSAAPSRTNSPKQTPPSSRTFADSVKNKAKKGIERSVEHGVEKGATKFIDWLIDDVAPSLWNEGIIPLFRWIKGKVTTDRKDLDQALEAHEKATSFQIKAQEVVEQSEKIPMTDEEAAEEVARFIRHYIGMIRSLIKLRNAGRLDEVKDLLPQLTNPATIERFNDLLASDQDLLKNSENNELKVLLGRDLYPDGKYAPINSDELECLAQIINSEE